MQIFKLILLSIIFTPKLFCLDKSSQKGCDLKTYHTVLKDKLSKYESLHVANLEEYLSDLKQINDKYSQIIDKSKGKIIYHSIMGMFLECIEKNLETHIKLTNQISQFIAKHHAE